MLIAIASPALALLSLLLLAGCADRPATAVPLQWREQGRAVQAELARDRLRIVGATDGAAIRRAFPAATAVEVDEAGAVVRFAAVDEASLADHARQLSVFGEVQAAIRDDRGDGWLGHRLSAALPAGADAAAIAARQGLTLSERPAYAPAHAIFASDPATLTSAVTAAAALVAAGDASEATPLVHRQARPRAR